MTVQHARKAAGARTGDERRNHPWLSAVGSSPEAWPPPFAASANSGPARLATCPLAAELSSPKAARRFVAATLRNWNLPPLEDVGVVVSELVTNALRYGLSDTGEPPSDKPVHLLLCYEDDRLTCAVLDPGGRFPVKREPDYTKETGRGLHVVEALCHAWGWTPLSTRGKAVWAAFAVPVEPDQR